MNLREQSNVFLKFAHLGVHVSEPNDSGFISITWFGDHPEYHKSFSGWFECSLEKGLGECMRGFHIDISEYETDEEIIEDLRQVLQEVICRTTVDIKKLLEAAKSIQESVTNQEEFKV